MKNGPYPYYEMPDIKTLRELVEYGKESRGDKPFLFNNNDEPISSKEFSELIKQLGAFILDEGIDKVNVGLVGENTNEWFISYFSIINSGNVIVPLDRNLSNKEKIELIERCECKALFYSKKDKDLVEELKNGIYDCLGCGFGVGLAWGCIHYTIDSLKAVELTIYEE